MLFNLHLNCSSINNFVCDGMFSFGLKLLRLWICGFELCAYLFRKCFKYSWSIVFPFFCLIVEMQRYGRVGVWQFLCNREAAYNLLIMGRDFFLFFYIRVYVWTAEVLIFFVLKALNAVLRSSWFIFPCNRSVLHFKDSCLFISCWSPNYNLFCLNHYSSSYYLLKKPFMALKIKFRNPLG